MQAAEQAAVPLCINQIARMLTVLGAVYCACAVATACMAPLAFLSVYCTERAAGSDAPCPAASCACPAIADAVCLCAGNLGFQGSVGGIIAAKSGHDVIMTPTSHCYFDYRQAPK